MDILPMPIQARSWIVFVQLFPSRLFLNRWGWWVEESEELVSYVRFPLHLTLNGQDRDLLDPCGFTSLR
jgi:hypothetical protein